jgi:hypothetical protein
MIQTKIKKCKTDPIKGLVFGDLDRPECNNLLMLYLLMSGKSKEEVAAECAEMGWGQFKPLLTETTIAHLQPIQDKYHEIVNDRGYLESVLHEGKEKAAAISNQTLKKVQDALGYAPAPIYQPAILPKVEHKAIAIEGSNGQSADVPKSLSVKNLVFILLTLTVLFLSVISFIG